MTSKRELRELRAHIKSLYYIQSDAEFKGNYYIAKQRIHKLSSKLKQKKFLKLLLTERMHRHAHHRYDYCVCRDVKKSLKMINDASLC